MITDDLNRHEDMWTPFKELQCLVDAAIAMPQDDMLKKLEDALRNHKQNFLTLLKNPPKSSQSREELRKGITDGITLPGMSYQTLSKDLVDEAIIISDMFNLNEYMSLDLLCTAQQQIPHHPGLTRGLVSVLLYYDGRKALVTSLRTLVQARTGISWAMESASDIISFITQYTQELMDNGVINKILNLISTLDLSKEIELLQKNRALGGPRHHRQVTDLFQSIQQTLADIVYFWSAQGGLPKESTFQLINQLKATTIQEDPKGGIDGITLALQMALLYALDLSILQKREDGEDVIQKLPLIAEPDFIPCLMRELHPGGASWQCPGLQAITHLAYGLAIASLRLAPQNLHPANFQDEDDSFVDSAINLKVFEFLHRTFFNNESIFKEEFYLRRLHSLVTDFIVFMPLKVKELRIRADETARTIQMYSQEGLDPPSNLHHHFEQLLLTVAFLYNKDPLCLDLVVDYWCPSEGLPATSYPYRSPPIQVSLFKFVRSSGDMLAPSLFVPYIKMLRSLSASPKVAKQAFNLLKQSGPGHMSNVSWDHFFTSLNQYYSNLRQELPVSSDPVYRHHGNYPRGITPQEVTCLQAVLSLIKTVAENDEYSRVALCDNPNWAPLSVLLGLVSCSISIPLKADLLSALASLAMSPDTSATLWHNLEASQVLSTVPSTSSYQPRGIQTELEELESRNEEFPLTRAMLHLLDILTNVPVPRLLGVGSRVPGFDPYLHFILTSVFSKFHTRSYKHPEEKWEVGRGCLQLFVKFLGQYEPQPEDFFGGRVELQGGGSTQVQPHPGFHIMVSLNSTSELLRLVLYLIDEGCNWLDTCTTFPGKEALESVMLCCLELIDKALGLQQRFFHLLSSSGSSLLLTGLNKLLLGINPRSGQPDHLLNIAKYVTYNSWLPQLSYLGVNILLGVSSYPSTHNQLLSIFTSSAAITTEIRHGFVECLEADGDDLIGASDEELGVQDKTKQVIIKLLQQCLVHPTPNVAHYLLGFDINKDVRKTIFQQPGILGFPRTCLHSLIAILDGTLSSKNVSPINAAKPNLVEAAYCMLHALCSNNKTSESILRFLRSSGDFLARHIACLPFKGPNNACNLNQMAWLLKIVAIEMKVLSTKMQHSQLANMLNLLTTDSSEVSEDNSPGDQEVVSLMHLSQHLSAPSTTAEILQQRYPLLLRLLATLDVAIDKVPEYNWQFFEPSQVKNVVSSCEEVVSTGLKLINVKMLHRTLVDELASIQGSSTAGQRQVIMQEIQDVLVYALKHNAQRSRVSSTIRYIDAWRQVTEVLFAVAPADILPHEFRQQLLLATIHLLLKKVLSDAILPDVANLLSGDVLLLMVNLRHCYVVKQKETKYGVKEAAMLDTTNGQAAIAQSNMATLKVILSSLLEWILGSGVSSQMLRAHLYGSLLNFLHIACLGGSEKYLQDNENGNQYVSRLDSTRYRNAIDQYSTQRQATLDVITTFGEGLVDVLCHDCTGGHDVCKMLALSCLDMLVELDPHSSWITFLSSRGYLKHLVDSLLDSDEKLVSILEAVPNNLRPLYVYESKMAMLCRVASTHTGAEMLLEQNGLSILSSMTVFDRHPDIKPNFIGMEIDFVPSVGHRYMQILFPALNLCDAVLTSLGTANQSCSSQITYFLLSHNEMVAQVLRSGSPQLQIGYLKELSRLTGVIARSSNQDKCHVSATASGDPDEGGMVHLQRVQKQMLGLFPRFLVSENVLRDLSGPVKTAASGMSSQSKIQRGPQDGTDAVLHFFQVACHLALYARNIVSSRGVDHRASGVIFKAGLADYMSLEKSGLENVNVGERGTPNLGVVIQQLVQCVGHYHKEITSLDLLIRKHSTVSNMNGNELNEFLPEGSVHHTPIAECRTLASEKLEKLLINKRQELKYCSFLIENCLYIVWCHLDYYMLRAIPKSNFGSSYERNKGEGYVMSITESSWKVSAQDISQMKQVLVTIFNDSFSKQLVETKQDQSATDKGFVEALLRRIKRLIQFVPVK